jgi:hypothetical protein
MEGIAKIYIQGGLKRTETDWHTLLPSLLSAGFQKEDIVCMPSVRAADLKAASIFNIYDPFLPRGQIPPFTSEAAHLPLSEIARVCSMMTVLQAAAALEGPDDSIVLVLDARAIVRRDFLQRLKDVATKEWTCLSLGHFVEGDSCFSDTEIREHTPMTPITSGALALRLSYVRKIVKTLLPFREPLDYELIFQTLLHKVTPQYVSPPIFYGGHVKN